MIPHATPQTAADVRALAQQVYLRRIQRDRQAAMPAPRPVSAPRPEPKAVRIYLAPIGPVVPKPPTPIEIQRAVAICYGLTAGDLTGKSRCRHLVIPRHLAMHIVHECCAISFPHVGRRFGGRDHTTVMHAVRKIDRLLVTDAALAAVRAEVFAMLGRGA